MSYNIELKEIALQPVLSIRKRISASNMPMELGRAYGAIIQYLNELGEQPVDAAFTAYYNMDMEDLDVEMGFPVSKALPGKGEINSSAISAGKQVACTFKGSYNQLEVVYKEMTDWTTQNNLVPTGVAYEFYYNSPVEVSEDELLTKVVFPVRQ